MQKKIVAAAAAILCASALPALAQSTGASKVELWGIVDAAVRHTNNEGANRSGLTKMVGGGMSQSRWGIKVEEDLGGGTKAFAEVENRFNADDGTVSTPFFQLSYVGLQGKYGRVSMGRQWNVLFDVVTSTYASFPYSPYMDAYKPELGMAAGARTSNALKYTLATPDRRWVGSLQYSFGEGNNADRFVQPGLAAANANMAVNAANIQAAGNAAAAAAMAAGATQAEAFAIGQAAGQRAGAQYAAQGIGGYLQGAGNDIRTVGQGAMKTMGGFLRYSADGISVGAGYLQTKLPGGSKLDAWTLGGSYRSGPLYLNLGYGHNKFKAVTAGAGADQSAQLSAAIRSNVDRAILGSMWSGQTNGGFQPGNADKRNMWKIGFGYQVTPQLNAGLHYFHAKQKGDPTGTSNGKANFIVAAADYAFSKRTDAYLAVDHTKVSGGAGMAIENPALTGGVAVRKRTGFTIGLRHRF